jgi:diadenosine tetraphosphate (Ap4A) HIT family hydrolase
MNAVRSRKDKRAYAQYLRSLGPAEGCQFCLLQPGDSQLLWESNNFKIIINRFPYALWDTKPVEEHLMLVPKQHTVTLKNLSPKESQEYVELISDYEHRGYNIYARSPGSSMKSVLHQHTHLIKLSPTRRRRIIITTIKPFIKIAR